MSSRSPVSFFRSRWVDSPGSTAELDPGELPAGFRAAGIACGIKRSGGRDLALLLCEDDEATSAARFTRNAVVAAPVTVSRGADLARLRAVVANSGNANVSNGEQGMEVARAMVREAASGLGLEPSRVGVASTGVIGLGLDQTPVLKGIRTARPSLSSSADDFAHAIMTTDRWPKYASLELRLGAGVVRLAAQAKGAGMVSPSFATMLCFVETDAVIDEHTLDRLLGAAIERSFERISVDGQLSTNDSVFMIAGGASGVTVVPGGDDEQTFAFALDSLLKQLAIEMVADGEGATRVARLEVRGTPGAAEPVAREVANSPLVKCALYGADPNWGRVLAAAGQALPDVGDVSLDLWIEEVQVASAGEAVKLDPTQGQRLRGAMAADEVEMRLRFGDAEQCEIFFCDLGPEYVRINSEYS